MVLTFDLGFGDIAVAAGKALPRVIILRLQDQTSANVNRRLETILREATDELAKGAIVSADEFRYRIRKLPIYSSTN